MNSQELVRLLDTPGSYTSQQSADDEVWLSIISARPDLRREVAFNKTISQRVLMELAIDPDEDVRRVIARTRRIGPDIMGLLARDGSEDVRAVLVYHPKLPDPLKEVLKRDTSSWVQRAVEEAGWA